MTESHGTTTDNTSILDRFTGMAAMAIPEKYRKDKQDRTTCAILLSVLCFNTLFSLISALFMEVGLDLGTLEDFAVLTGRYIIWVTITVYAIALYTLLKLEKLKSACQITTAGLFASGFMGIMVTGGYTESPLASLLVIPLVFAFLLLGFRSGVMWSAFAMLSWTGLWALETNDAYQPIQVVTDEHIRKILTLITPVTIGSMVIAGLIIYEFITQGLRNELQEERNKFHWDATHDALTGLPNRPEFFQRLQLSMRIADVNKQPLVLVYFDLDGFKPVNDDLGHHAGDIVLKVISERLQSILRGSDTVARLGGDEFGIILNGVSINSRSIESILEKALKAVAESIIIEGRSVSVGASLGVASYESDDTPDNLTRKADEAMYKAKEKKNTWCFYNTLNNS
jgi:diguanylate cyclase (GGDEF)-like protein